MQIHSVQGKGFASVFVVLLILFILATVGLIFGRQFLKTNGVQPVPSPWVDLTANWKIYSDSFVSFRYPNDWMVELVQTFASHSEVDFKYNLTTVLSLSYIANYNNGTGKPFATLDEFLGAASAKATNALLGGRPARKVSDFGDAGHVVPYVQVVTFSLDNKFIISFYYQQDYYKKPEANTAFDQVLSTLKFVGQEEAEGRFCGGIAGITCPSGYRCQLDGNYPDAGGKCKKMIFTPN